MFYGAGVLARLSGVKGLGQRGGVNLCERCRFKCRMWPSCVVVWTPAGRCLVAYYQVESRCDSWVSGQRVQSIGGVRSLLGSDGLSCAGCFCAVAVRRRNQRYGTIDRSIARGACLPWPRLLLLMDNSVTSRGGWRASVFIHKSL